MEPLGEALDHWHEFYTLLGTASATMVGLLFVAATVGAGVFSSDRRAPLRMFMSASVVNFSSVLVVCLIALAPLQTWLLFGAPILCCGIGGLVYSGLAWRDAVRDGLNKSIALDDRIWYAVLPAVGYAMEAVSGVTLVLHRQLGCVVLAFSMGALLMVGIHNAWDITVWSITRRRE